MEHRMTYKSGGRCTQVDYILCRRVDLKEIEDCNVVEGESVVNQHRMVVCRMTLEIKKRKRVRAEPRIKWWKLKKEDCKVECREKVRQTLGGSEGLPDSWETTADVVRVTARRVLGVTSAQRKEEKETWWWNGKVQESIQRKRMAKKKWDSLRDAESRQEYREIRHKVKREMAKSKEKVYDELYERLDTKEGEKDLYRSAKQRDRAGKVLQQVSIIKNKDENVLTSEESVLSRWKEYFERLMNEENKREEVG
ncbi:uncharacterized protein LOC127526866 [Erpetoichthys calabaricus]|uniref:uncharacterized protein LOC127526866 n=1 Tax=Erpetoichthys calabaricus TaxID=27687 RepID=UPI0022344033|nr:uncharacterized protein LOC127526866 [Erpetoichthys calabaricus]